MYVYGINKYVYDINKNYLCFLEGEQNLIFVDLKAIHHYSFKENFSYKLVTNMTRGVALDIDIAAGRIFYTDVTKNTIYSSLIKNLTKQVEHVSINFSFLKYLIISKGFSVIWDWNDDEWSMEIPYHTKLEWSQL